MAQPFVKIENAARGQGSDQEFMTDMVLSSSRDVSWQSGRGWCKQWESQKDLDRGNEWIVLKCTWEQ